MEDTLENYQKNKILIAGPCVMENLEDSIKIAEEVKKAGKNNGFHPIFKASLDKANRTSGKAFRTIGMKKALYQLYETAKEVKIDVITDVHEPRQVKEVEQFVDYLQIPAFLARQTDLIYACAKSGKPTVIKKPQFISHESAKFIEEKYYDFGGTKMYICERGNSFGYSDLIVDVTSIQRLKESCEKSGVILDCTHSLQRPNRGSSTKGNAKYIETMVRFGSVMGADGLFIETHPEPSKSPSDSENMLPLHLLNDVLKKAKGIYGTS
jgi:2-dehydro-3-deoxyphosphooctonate aldolase (KDO 8-P synthase)